MSVKEDIKKKIVTIVDETVNMREQVAIYCDMMNRIKTERKITPVIRFTYEKYYGMNSVGLSYIWKNSYFETANKYLNNSDKICISFEELMDEIGICDGKSIQPSFVSKLLHTINTDEPIYDKYVRIFLETGDPIEHSIEKRKETAIKIYEEKIKLFYSFGKYYDMKELLRQVFNDNYAPTDSAYIIDEVKKIDFIIWALGKKGHKLSEFID